MLILSYLGESRVFELSEGINLLGVRNPPKSIPEHFIHAVQLSPSQALFSDTQQWKKQYSNKRDWWQFYVERFQLEIKERKDMVRSLYRLEELLDKGQTVRLFCYCKDVNYCHRSLIGNEMLNRGYEVDFRFVENIEQLSLF